MDLDGHLVFAILLAAGEKGVPLEPDFERVEVATELAAGKFFECCARKMVSGRVHIRVKPEFIRAIDEAIRDRRNAIQDSVSNIILPISHRPKSE